MEKLGVTLLLTGLGFLSILGIVVLVRALIDAIVAKSYEGIMVILGIISAIIFFIGLMVWLCAIAPSGGY